MLNKCLLIAPSEKGREFPRGMLSIASFLNKNNIEVEVLIISYDFAKEDNSRFKQRIHLTVESKIKDFNPDFIGVSNTFTRNYCICLDILESCKKTNPEVKTAIGGQHVTFLDSCVLKESKAIDFIIRGEGEWTMLELMRTLPQEKGLDNVDGISFRRGRRIIRNRQRNLGNLLDLPPLDFNMLPVDFIKRAYICNLLVRGCSFNCSFCSDISFWRHKVRLHPIEQLLDEIEILFKKYGKMAMQIEDSMLNMSCKYFYDFCSGFYKRKSGLNISPGLSIYTRIDTVTDKGLKMLRKSGINKLSIGIENGSEKVLKMMNKGIIIKQIVSNLKNIKKYKFDVESHWIFGHPGDSPTEAQKTLDFIKFLFDEELIGSASVWKFLPFPGCKFFHQPQKYGVEILSFDWSKWAHSTDEHLCQLKDFSAEGIQGFYEKAKAVSRAYTIADRYKEDKSFSLNH
ncbi:MAG: radical SAM protein [Candidatus Omnitrophota bacterium]